MAKKTALFIAAGSGMGADAAQYLASKNYRVGILSSSGKGEKLAKSLGGVGHTGSNLSSDDIQSIVNKMIKKWGRIDVLVNSAGHGPKGPILELTDEEWHTGLETYFLNIVRATRIVTPIMEKQKDGSIINISTFAVFEPDPMFPTSGVFRAGLSSFTKLFSNQYAKYNIRINNILPGFINSFPEKKEFIKRIPLNRYGKVQEISALVELLASERGAYITGQNIRIDGGLTKSI